MKQIDLSNITRYNKTSIELLFILQHLVFWLVSIASTAFHSVRLLTRPERHANNMPMMSILMHIL